MGKKKIWNDAIKGVTVRRGESVQERKDVKWGGGGGGGGGRRRRGGGGGGGGKVSDKE